MWGEITNAHTNQQKIWNRASILSERLWNSKIAISENLNDIAIRLVAQSRRLNERGIKTSPVTVQLCEENMHICF
jgi:hexosaminidase